MTDRPAISAATKTVALFTACCFVQLPTASAQDTEIDRLNAIYSTISADKRADLLLLPALANIEEFPAQAVLPRTPGDDPVAKAMAIPVDGPGWPEALAWATAPSQRAALEALKLATNDEDGQLPMGFGLPYGINAVADQPGGLDLVVAGVLTDLGDPPLLATPVHGHLEKLNALVALVNIEATRLSADGDIVDAIELLIDLLYVGRQMADREYHEESQWGLDTMNAALQRIRDVAYTDFRSDSHELNDATLVQIIDRLNENLGFLRLDRLRFPRADRFAGDQIVGLVFSQFGAPSPEFGKIMARVGAGKHQLTLFSQIPRWDTLAISHNQGNDTKENIRKVQNDWAQRWALDPFDSRLANQTYQDSLKGQSDALVNAIFSHDSEALFVARRRLDTELTGTRAALAVLAYYYRQGAFAPQLASIRPQFLRELEDDPFNPSTRDRGGIPPLMYFVPIRDTRQDAGVTTYSIIVDIIEPTAPNFNAKLDDSHFVLYSVGPDGKKDWAKNVREDMSEVFNGDFLIWPPTISLYRHYLDETGQLQ